MDLTYLQWILRSEGRGKKMDQKKYVFPHSIKKRMSVKRMHRLKMDQYKENQPKWRILKLMKIEDKDETLKYVREKDTLPSKEQKYAWQLAS